MTDKDRPTLEAAPKHQDRLKAALHKILFNEDGSVQDGYIVAKLPGGPKTITKQDYVDNYLEHDVPCVDLTKLPEAAGVVPEYAKGCPEMLAERKQDSRLWSAQDMLRKAAEDIDHDFTAPGGDKVVAAAVVMMVKGPDGSHRYVAVRNSGCNLMELIGLLDTGKQVVTANLTASSED